MQNQIPENWQKVKLGEVVNVYGGGTPSTQVKTYWNGDIPWLTPAELTNYDSRFIAGTASYITELGLQNSSAKIMPENSILLTSRATIGNVTINTVPMATNQGFINIEPKEVDRDFFYYWLKNNDKYLNQIAIGSTFPELSKSVFKEIETEIPRDLETQKRISSVLATFDDKIEVNNKIANTLEEMAQVIFKEWFINKKGWKIGKLSDIAAITMGQSPSSKFYNNDHKGLPFHQGVTNFGERYITTNDIYCSTDARLAESGDILFSVRAPVGRINIADRKIIIGRGLSAIRHKQGFQSYLFYLLKRRFKTEDSIGSGSVFPATTKEELNNLEISIPDVVAIQKFENTVSIYDKKMKLIYLENQKLRIMRDLLLSKLMRGEIGI